MTAKNNPLKKIAFVAMPFRTKNTGLEPGKGPESVNFDALWEKAVKPALIALEYMPLRADEQTGSTIIKDMLSALVHADLVLADISIPNGNVYYEAGIRHAARKTGCILINADWSRPLFDLGQITQIRYPLGSNSPTDRDYANIKSVLVEAIPKLAASVGPVYELVSSVDTPDAEDAQLRERMSVLYEFNTKLNAARLKASNGDKESLRAMCSDVYLKQLPGFALKELIGAVRDHLNWPMLVNLVDRLPGEIRNDAYFQEQKALALSMGQKVLEATAIFEEVIKRDGKSCVRLGNLGSMYRRLASTGGERQRIRYMPSAIRAFREGMRIDLNDYYCSHKLLVMLFMRDRPEDKVEASNVNLFLKSACQRALDAGVEDEWLYPTLLIRAFYNRDVIKARQYADRVLEQPWSNWKLMGLLTDLLCLLDLSVDTDITEKLKDKEEDESVLKLLSICRDIQLLLPVPQKLLLDTILPMLDNKNNVYRKSSSVYARLAIPGERVVTITASGEETAANANEGDVVVMNETETKECYIVEAEVFDKRYESEVVLTNDFKKFGSKGRSLALQIDHEITTLLGVGRSFFIIPAWKSEQYAEEGDYFVMPLPEKKEIYRVGRPEFEATYVVS